MELPLKIDLDENDIAKLIDHTLLRADARQNEIRKLCEEARKYGFKSVCVASGNVELCRKLLRSSGVKICCVVGFPLGSVSTETKVFEAKQAIRHGADEIDMVMNIGALKSGNRGFVYRDILKIRQAAKKKILKLIIETCYLTRNEKIEACLIAKKAGVDFVKTSTGFGPKGAQAADVRLIKKAVGGRIGVKASGGIKTLEDARRMIKAGASRLGTSASVSIIKEAGLSDKN